MGSLTSRPSAPPPQQIIYVPPPVPAAAASNTTEPAADPAGETSQEARKNNLLQRNRGRFGTIQTSFRGLLTLGNSSAQRKTLLGE